MRILVTGASGFIGLPVVRCLEQEGHKVLALSRSILNMPSALSVNWLKADLSSPETYQDSVKNFLPEILIHLAWQDIPNFSFEKSRDNLNQSLDLISFVINLDSCKKIVVSGSCFELNQLHGECQESRKGTPKDDFTWAKHTLLSWLEVESKKKNIHLAWMRIFYVYGPRQRAPSLVPLILTHLQRGALPELRTTNNSNDFIFVDDVVTALTNTVSAEFQSGIYNLGSGRSTQVLEVCRMAEQIVLNTETLTKQMEANSKSTSCEADFWANTKRSKEHLDWQPSTRLNDGIEQTWKWLRQK